MQEKKIDWNRLKLVFDHAGSIKEQQIICKLLSKLDDSPKELLDQIKRKEVLFQQRFLKNTSRYIGEVRNFREKFSLPASLSEKRALSKFIKKKVRRAEKKLHDKNKRGLHVFRTKVKDIMYVYEALPKGIRDDIKLNNKSFDKLQKKLGDWHDTNSVVDFLSRQQFSEKLKVGISKLKKREEKQIKDLFKNPGKLSKK